MIKRNLQCIQITDSVRASQLGDALPTVAFGYAESEARRAVYR
ncbi:hypothetical protein [Pelagicoccus mobilis]|nr:hypothetical protein [Pelagicoccus mobilis]